MIQTKVFEVRDSGTYMPCVGILLMVMPPPEGFSPPMAHRAQVVHSMITRAGYVLLEPQPPQDRLVKGGSVRLEGPLPDVSNMIIFGKLEEPHKFSADPLGHDAQGTVRTMQVAHQYVAKHWWDLEHGDVIDVEYILGVTGYPKESEAIDPMTAQSLGRLRHRPVGQ